MACEDVRAHVADYLAGAATATAAEVASHLRTCRTCAVEVEGLRDIWDLLGQVPAERSDSAALRTRFDRALAEYQQVSGEAASSPTRPHVSLSTWWPAGPVVQVGLAAAVLLLGVVLGRQMLSPPGRDPQMAALRQEVREMRQMVTLSLMQQQSASERLKGVTWTGRIDQPGREVVTALLDALMHDPDVNVRLATVDALRRFAEREGVRRGALDALQRQTSPLVQIALIDFLVDVAGRESAVTFRGLSQDPMVDQTVRERAAWALQQVG
jgi:hypothetical protein